MRLEFSSLIKPQQKSKNRILEEKEFEFLLVFIYVTITTVKKFLALLLYLVYASTVYVQFISSTFEKTIMHCK